MSARRPKADLPGPGWGWQSDAACQDEDVVLFFGPPGEPKVERESRERQAKQVCEGCTVRTDCLNYAVSRPEKYGTWGSMNEDERQAERRRRMRKVHAA